VVCAMAVADSYALNSEQIRIQIPQKGEETRTVDPKIPARLKLQQKLDDTGEVWNFIEQLGKHAGTTVNDITITAESGMASSMWSSSARPTPVTTPQR